MCDVVITDKERKQSGMSTSYSRSSLRSVVLFAQISGSVRSDQWFCIYVCMYIVSVLNVCFQNNVYTQSDFFSVCFVIEKK